MKNRILYILAIVIGTLFFFESAFSKSKLLVTKGKFPTYFTIVIDSKTYETVKDEVLQYKSLLEKESLGTHILIGDWKSPDDLKLDLIKIKNRRGAILEGVVFIGDIPVVRVVDFQHATTAFKMDQTRFPIEEHAITSDRFYDDTGLIFDFVGIDSVKSNHFYYRLSPKSRQYIRSDFYSSRIFPPKGLGKDGADLIKDYLKKVISARNIMNPLDNVIFFNGHGYNSDCFTVWNHMQFVIRDLFPLAYNSASNHGFYNFRQDPFMKYSLFELMQRESTDLFVYHEHGAYDTQYINGDYPGVNTLKKSQGYDGLGPMDLLAISIRNSYRRYSEKRAQEYKQSIIDDLGFTEEFFEKDRIDSLRVYDSTFSAKFNIVLQDLVGIRSNAKVSIFDACYNGSFHKDDYIAAYHIFSQGNALVAQGNTVNVLQDKWSMQLIGLLSEGVRVGFWQKETQTLESHLFGDPTFRFSVLSKNKIFSDKLNLELATQRDNSYWKDLLDIDNPNLQALALKMLWKNGDPALYDILIDNLKDNKYPTVRLQAMMQLLDMPDIDYSVPLQYGLMDPYELTRRLAVRYSGFCGNSKLIPYLVSNLVYNPESFRVQLGLSSSLQMFDALLVSEAINLELEKSNIKQKRGEIEEFASYLRAQEKNQEKKLKIILDKCAKESERIFEIRMLRNNNNHKYLESYLSVIGDPQESILVQETMVEALGWFRWSEKKGTIIDYLNDVLNNRAISSELSNKIRQTIFRLMMV